MTQERLAEIEARAVKATPGPWSWCPYQMFLLAGNAMVADTGDLDDLNSVRMRGVGAKLPLTGNADFIAHARTDIPALIAHIRKLEAERLTAEERQVIRRALDTDMSSKLVGMNEFKRICAVRAKIESMGAGEAALATTP